MEIIPEGKNFRLVQDNELPELLLVLEQYMPEAVKVRNLLKKTVQSLTVLEKTYISVYLKQEKINKKKKLHITCNV